MSDGLVLVAGATGSLGREVVRELKQRGHRVRAIGRSEKRLAGLRDLADEVTVADALRPETLPTAFDGVDRVFSCMGASVIPLPQYGSKPFTQIDWPANRNLIHAAVAAEVEKFVYVSVFGAERLPQMDFVRGHELVVEELRRSDLNYSVLRPTGFFSAMEEILQVASMGMIPEFNGGSARTNPIHEADLAEACVDAFNKPAAYEADIGGPEPLTRREIAALALKAIGKEARHVRVPVGLLRFGGRAYRLVSPRVGHLMTFIAEILVDDFVAPCYGTRRIGDYFFRRAAELKMGSHGTAPDRDVRGAAEGPRG